MGSRAARARPSEYRLQEVHKEYSLAKIWENSECLRVLDPQLKRALADRVRYYNELGIYDFYRREPAKPAPPQCKTRQCSRIQQSSQNSERK